MRENQDVPIKGTNGTRIIYTVVYREYPELEHLVIVQEALPDVFAFFDRMVKKN